MGCGRTGATLATSFQERGHTVAVIDIKADAFRRLPADFSGQKITGVGFDRETLGFAGVKEAYAFAAVSSGDNSNILAARVVRETYGVENVIARISDPGRAEVYRRLGIPTVAPVPWTANQIVTRLLPGGSDEIYEDAAADIHMRRLSFNDGWIGHRYADLERAAGVRVAYLSRFGSGILPHPDTLVQEGDDVHVVLAGDTLLAAQKVFSKPPRDDS